MSLLQMSLSGAILIVVIILVRAVFINKLPKRTFLVLWVIALLRLLVPFSIPSAFSAYSLINRCMPMPVRAMINELPMSDLIPTAPTVQAAPTIPTGQTGQLLIDGRMTQAQMQTQMPIQAQTQLKAQKQVQTQAQKQTQPQLQTQTDVQMQTQIQAQLQIPHVRALKPMVSVRSIIWFIGAISCAAFFTISYLHWRFEFRTSLPVSNDFITQWLGEHKLKRAIAVRQSGRITAPLTYGIFHPVILMPQKIDWENKQQLQYILLHEYVHICRFDIVWKLISALALCIHWFNPTVYMMYILFNRDIELACDEGVIRRFGEGAKSAYALTLIGMEEKKSGFTPSFNSFSKNAIEERITAIMKIKKTTFAAIIAAVALITSVTTAFATSAAMDGKQETKLTETDMPETGITETDMPETGITETEMSAAGFSEEEYAKLLALQFDGYEDMSVSEYQNKVWELTDTVEYRNLLERLSKNEKLYEMKDSNETATFLFYVLEPLTAEKWQKRSFSGSAASDYSGTVDNAVLEYIITLEISDADTLTVHEYNIARKTAVRDLENIINNMTAAELRDEALMQEMIDEEINNITWMWEVNGLKVAIEYAFVPLSGELATEDMDEWEKRRQEEWEQILAPYLPFGLTYQYDSATDGYKMYFQGKEVRGLSDERKNLWITEHSGIGMGIYDEAAIELYAVYENDELTGLREATAEEQEEWTKRRQQITYGQESENAGESGENTQKNRENAKGSRMNAQEIREYAYATEEDYSSLFVLKTPDYADMSVADFNRALLDWGNETDDDRWERLQSDIGWNDFQVSLDNEQLSFVKLTVGLSMTENAAYVRSIYTGRGEKAPSFNQYLPDKTIEENGTAAWCSLWYQFSYNIADKNAITIGERDRRIGGMLDEIQAFWDEADIEEMLKMTEEDVVARLQKIAEKYSSSKLVITLDGEHVQFECMDERNIRRY